MSSLEPVVAQGLSLTDVNRRGLLVGGAGLVGAALLPTEAHAVTRASLDRALRARLGSRATSASVAVYDTRTRATYSLNPTWTNECASIVKVLILVTLQRARRRAGGALTASDRSLATSMIRVSDNDAASTLLRRAGGLSALQTMARDLGMARTTVDPAGRWGITRTTSVDQVVLMRAIAWGTPHLTLAERQYALSLMKSVVSSQRFGVGQSASGVTIAVKNGWLPRSTGAWRHNSIGTVSGGGRSYAVAILTRGNGSDASGRALTTDLARIVYSQLATPLR